MLDLRGLLYVPVDPQLHSARDALPYIHRRLPHTSRYRIISSRRLQREFTDSHLTVIWKQTTRIRHLSSGSA